MDKTTGTVDVVTCLWGGVTTVDKATGMGEGSPLCTRPVDNKWVAVVVEAAGRVEGPPTLWGTYPS